MQKTSKSPIIVAAAAFILFLGACDKSEESKDGDKKENAKSEDKGGEKPAKEDKKPEEKADPGKVELEVVDVPELGKLKMPKGSKKTADKNWSYDLGELKSIRVSWEPHGVKDLAAAEKTSKILGNAETVKTSKTLDNGTHMIERVRESDGWTFVVVFAEDWYVKCVAPQDKMDICHEIVTSKE